MLVDSSTVELDREVAEVPVDEHRDALPVVVAALEHGDEEAVGVAAHDVEPALVEPEPGRRVTFGHQVEQVDRVRLDRLRRRRHHRGDLGAREVERRHLLGEVVDLVLGEHARQTVAHRHLVVQDRPHLAVVPDVGATAGRQRIGEEVLVPAPLQELVATVEAVVVLGEEEERSVVRHLGDGRRAVVEGELVHAVRRHHGAELGHPHEAPGIAVVVPRRVEGGSVASLGCIHGIAHHARIAQVPVGVLLATTMKVMMATVIEVV